MPDFIVFGLEADRSWSTVSREVNVADQAAAEAAVFDRYGPRWPQYKAVNYNVLRSAIPTLSIAHCDALLTAIGAQKPSEPAALTTARNRIQNARDEAQAMVV